MLAISTDFAPGNIFHVTLDVLKHHRTPFAEDRVPDGGARSLLTHRQALLGSTGAQGVRYYADVLGGIFRVFCNGSRRNL